MDPHLCVGQASSIQAATETYLLDELTMQQGDVWVYDGTLHAAGADDVSFDDGGVAITCDG